MKKFAKIIKEYKVPIGDENIKNLFEMFDKTNTGLVNYEEFLRYVRGEVNATRKGLIELAFKKLDKEGRGAVDVKYMKGQFDAKNHPDVKTGKKNEDQVLGEFLETFEMFANLKNINSPEINKDEFQEYYENVSAAIDDDKYFELVIASPWKLYGEDFKRSGLTDSASKGRPLTASQSAPFGTTDEPTSYTTSSRLQKKPQYEGGKMPPAGYPSWPKISPNKQESKYGEKQLLDTFRQCVLARGIRGIFGIKRAFKVSLISLTP